jgi:hypothetical protein
MRVMFSELLDRGYKLQRSQPAQIFFNEKKKTTKMQAFL